LGIDVKNQDADTLLAKLNEKIEEMIGSEITASLNDEQLDELVKLQESGNDDEIGEWIAQHVPNYMEIVQDNIDIAIGDLVDNIDNPNDTLKEE